uniref:IQ motif and ubiquitin-like domain-containing protein n=1 Tax=Pyramimonas obovata TaxID=1411642 RepID=A0A7S0WJW0_9CHLO|mmetsp:Transcript_27846/g.60940  ORF Transcript_27846/g.60940 Transcript_27846/m.60940 type:complete len:620 (+) Transcript_27846:277-2136(+)
MVFNEEEAATKIQAVQRGRAARKEVDAKRNEGQPSEEPPSEQPEEEPAPEEPAPENPAAEEPAPEKPATEEPAPENPPAEDPAPGNPAAEESAPEKPAAEESAPENPEESASAPPAEPSAAPEPQVDHGEDATCHFIIYPENYRHTKAFPVTRTVNEVLEELSAELHIDRSALSLALDAQRLNVAETLQGLGVTAGSTVEFQLVVDEQEVAMDLQALGNVAARGLPNFIDVEIVPDDDGPTRVVSVYIESTQQGKMQWLGGFRNKRNGATYLHATCQTDRKPKVYEKDKKFTRETQTYEMKTRTQQTVRDCSTQMARPDLLLDPSMDREMVAGRYMTSEEHHQLRVKKTIVIQRYTRGCKARKRARELRKKREERQQFLRQEAERKQAEAEERRRKEIERRMRPRTTADFEILYNELEAWRLQETQKINEAGLPEAERRAALRQLLHKETKLLQTIDRLKIAANAENRDVRIAHTLSDMAAPKSWEISDGTGVEVHTPFTTRSKELMQLYNGLRLPLLTTDERLDVLLHVKWTVKEFDCNLTREAVELIDREADLLNRGRNPTSMDGLRRRIANLFLQFIETPEFNPEATRYQIVPGDFEMDMPETSRMRNAKNTQTIT